MSSQGSRLNTKELYHKLIEKYGDEDNFTDTIITNVSADNVPYLTFKPFVNNPYIRQAFSTRLGGVSINYSVHYLISRHNYSLCLFPGISKPPVH